MVKIILSGKPLKAKFLGIFDTVESIGNAAQNKNPELYRTRIEDYIEHSMHLVASLEMRQSFPLTPTGKPTANTVKDLFMTKRFTCVYILMSGRLYAYGTGTYFRFVSYYFTCYV